MGILRRLQLEDFRNYSRQEMEFGAGLNLLVGGNGQGKTNLLEAIQFLAILRSFRTSQARPLHRWGTRTFRLRGELEQDGQIRRLALEFGQHRRLMVDGEPVNRASEFIRHFCCATFVPEDIGLVKGTAGDRRRLLDILATQLYAGYLAVLQDYAKALKGRNALLRQEQVDGRAVRAFDTVLVDRGALVLRQRYELMGRLSEQLARVGGELFASDRQLSLRYLPSVVQPPEGTIRTESIADAFRAELGASFERDLSRQHTTRGPHRDDFMLCLDERPLAEFGSEGQCRLAVLALKMAAGDIVMALREDEPVIWLVDDVVGELDQRARQAFYRRLRQADQTFLVATGDLVLADLPPARVYDVADACVTPRESP